MTNEYFLIDLTDNKDAIRRERVYDLIANLCLKYGVPGRNLSKFTSRQVFQMWEYGYPYPLIKGWSEFIRIKHIKWYIRNKLEWKDQIWNGDFIRGLMLHGNIQWSKTHFPSFFWRHNEFLYKIIKSSPFGGKLSFYKTKNYKGRIQKYSWCWVPAIYLPHDEESISYLAGFLAGGVPYVKDGVTYARYKDKFAKLMEQLGIPIEGKIAWRKWILISPIWPALFTIRMPECIRDVWTGIKKPYKVDFYAPILWKTYINNDFVKNGIPYLQSRRTIYYKFKCEDGAMAILDRVRVEKNLVALDYRIRDIVKCWYKEKNEERI